MNATTLKYLIMAVFIGLGIFAVLVWAGIVPGLGGGGNTGTATIKRAELTVWGTADDKAQFDAMVEAFRGPNPGVKITYEKKSPEGYEDELVRAFAAGKGPDLFALHNTWLVKYGDLLAPASKELVSPAGLKGTLADVALRDFAAGDALYGLPLAIDTPERAPSCLKNLRASSSPWPPCRKSKERLSIRIMPIIGDTACIKIQRTRSWRGNF